MMAGVSLPSEGPESDTAPRPTSPAMSEGHGEGDMLAPASGSTSKPRKPSRQMTDLTPHLPTLLQFWERGMQNSRQECKTLITEASQATKLPERTITIWIKNHKAKKRKQRERENGQEPERRTKVTKRATKPYNCFMRHHLKGKGKPDFRAAAEEYKRIQSEDPDLYEQFVEEAEKTATVSLQDLGEEDKQREARRLFKTVCETMKNLQACGWDGFAVLYDHRTTSYESCGTSKGDHFLRKNSALPNRFAIAASGHTYEKINEGTEALRSKVREVMNRKWHDIGGKGGFPYERFENKKGVAVEGVPEGCKLRNPCNLGPSDLKALLRHQDDLVIKEQNQNPVEETSTGSDQDQNPVGETSIGSSQDQNPVGETSTGSSQDSGIPSAEQLLRGVSEGLQQAAQDRAEVTLDSAVGASRKGKRSGKDKGKTKKKGKKKVAKNQFDSEDDIPLTELMS